MAAAAILAVSGCQADAFVKVRVDEHGAGQVAVTVTLDREAAQRLGKGLDPAGLAKAGWRVTGPAPMANGGAEIKATKPFANPAQAEQALAELGGGVRGFAIARTSTLVRNRTSVHGSVDLSDWAAVVSDPGLTAKLGSPLGMDAAELQQQLGRPAAEAFRVDLAVHLPGSQTGKATASVRPGQRAAIATSAQGYNLRVLVPAAVSAFFLLLAAASAARAARRARRIRAIAEL